MQPARPRIIRAYVPDRETKVEPSPPCAVLIDGSALYLASAHRPDNQRLNYPVFVDVLAFKVPGLHPAGEGEPKSIWSMWTSADPSNSSQTRFLDFAEKRLQWEVRACRPWQAHVVSPDLLFGVGADLAKANRLMRFDTSIAFAMARLCDTHRVIVVSDSFALREPIARVNEYLPKHGKVVLAFFGQALDPRWRGNLQDPFSPEFIDLDDHESELFGVPNQEVREPEKRSGLIF
ncbi:hypothetical protein GHT07_18955 [Caenimonas koreensis DSM 17982]|uniref:NYN domain-containing protein n=1 Tax=Caenimonas koreensis DSM 17982 TaxID=1121255 RepID=A0A844AXT9_9BURK|nr:hypothetical protein [Caenimonas koreensis]MRD49360.1 hypothetical protein [Caenimonas koreensis DSM 17982]